MVDRQALVDTLTTEDIIKIIESLGGYLARKEYEDGELSSLIFPTICHHGTSEKLYYYTDTKIFKCYTECDILSIYDLVMSSKNINFYESLLYIVNTLGYHSIQTKSGFMDFQRIDDWDIVDKYISFMQRVEIPELPIYNDNIMEIFDDVYYSGWVKEGISTETMIKYNIKYCASQGRIVIPHYNIYSDLVGIRGRALFQEDIDLGAKYKPIKIEGTLYRHQTKYNLYGLNHNIRAITKLKKVMLVEAEKSVMQCDTFYGDNNFTVGVSGSSVSIFQRDLLLSAGVNEVIIAFDKEYFDEESTEKYLKKLIGIAYMFINYCTVYILRDKNDITEFKSSPTDCGKEVLEILMKDKYKIEGSDNDKI